MSKFKIGDRVEWVGGPEYHGAIQGGRWDFMVGAKARVSRIEDGYAHVHWDDHADREPRMGLVQFWCTGGWTDADLRPGVTLSPFEAEVQAYIDQELRCAS